MFMIITYAELLSGMSRFIGIIADLLTGLGLIGLFAVIWRGIGKMNARLMK